ncbi:MAG TPA: hypothetical protein VMU32_10535 [Solirubrobacteraceae bacterium]|nr:hypothetical protein [Solirubrobacteraceae bacterium]
MIAVIAVASGASASSAYALAPLGPGWMVNGLPLILGAKLISKPSKKVTIRLPEGFEVVCEKLKDPTEAAILSESLPALYVGTFSAEECNKVVNLEEKEEPEACEVEGKTINFNELGANVVWIEATGSERYVYFNRAFHGGKWETSNGLWATIKIKSISGKTCPSLLLGMHPLNGQLLAKLKMPTTEQPKKTFTSVETGGCAKAKTYYEGEPRTSHSAEGLTIGGEKGAELCGEFELELENGDEFSVS